MIPEQEMTMLDTISGLTMPNDCRALAKFAGSVPRDRSIIELGSHTGLSTCWIAIGSRYGNGAKVHAIDPWPDPRVGSHDDPFRLKTGNGVYAQFLKNTTMAGVRDLITVHRTDSVSAAQWWTEPEPVGMVFIDAVHEENAIREDFLAWDAHLVPGGIMALHDMCPEYPGTEIVINKTILKSGYTELHRPKNPKVDSLWVGRKPE